MQINAAAEWINSTFAEFDLAVTLFISKLAQIGNGALTPFMEFVSFLCKGGILLILLAIVLMLYRKTRRFGVAMLAGLAIGAFITNCVVKLLVARPRPYIDESSVYHQLWKAVGCNTLSDKSFPSGHTTAAFAAVVGPFMLSKKKHIAWTMFIFSVLVGISRIYLVVHYPSDVLGGMLVGILGGVLGYVVMRKLPQKFYDSYKPYRLNCPDGSPKERRKENPKGSLKNSVKNDPKSNSADRKTAGSYSGKHCR